MSPTSMATATTATGPSTGPRGFDFGLGDLPAVREGVARLLHGFDGARGVREAQRFQEWAANLETLLLAEAARAGADNRTLDDLAGANGTRSKAEVERRKQRARTVDRNPNLVRPAGPDPLQSETSGRQASNTASVDPGSGDIASDPGDPGAGLNSAQLDALGWADGRTDGAAARDPYLIRLVSMLTADQAMREVRRYVQDHHKAEIQERQERQRTQRRAYRQCDGEFDRIVIEGDTPSVDEMWARIEAEANRIYQQEGGREVPPDRHPRTRTQRLFDAAHAFFTDAGPTGSKTDGRGATRATLVLTTTVENAAAGFPEPVELIGTGPISREFLGRILPDTQVAGMLFAKGGHPLWLGRSVRHATFPQWLALAVRDRGCVLCGANAGRCQAHHVRPWESEARGETNVDEMCLLCADCHLRLHHDRQTLEWDPDIERWRARAARPHELPPTPATRKRPCHQR